MKILMKAAIAVLALCTFGYALEAMADTAATTGPAAPTMSQLGMWSMITMAACALVGWGLRKFSDAAFFHSAGGALLFAFLSALGTSLAGLAEGGGISGPVIAKAVLAAVLTATGMSNPSMNAATGASRLGLVLPVLLALGLTSSGCAFGACELSKLPSTLSALVASVASIASQPAGYLQDLEQLGKSVAPDQVDCIAVALAAEAVKPGHPTWRGQMGNHLQEYLGKRREAGAKLSCAPVPELEHAAEREAYFAGADRARVPAVYVSASPELEHR